MYNLKVMEDFSEAIYHGFTLKNGYWYGIDTETETYVTTSGWTCNGCVAIYFKAGNKWDMQWVDYEDDFDQFNLSYPEIKGDKLPYEVWLEQNPDYSFWTEEDLYEAYDQYLYDGMSVFAIKILEKQKQKQKYQECC